MTWRFKDDAMLSEGAFGHTLHSVHLVELNYTIHNNGSSLYVSKFTIIYFKAWNLYCKWARTAISALSWVVARRHVLFAMAQFMTDHVLEGCISTTKLQNIASV